MRICEQPPFTVQLIDENDETVVEQKFNASAGEFRMDRVRVVRAKVDPRQLNFERRNWTIYSVRDANGYRNVFIRLFAPPHNVSSPVLWTLLSQDHYDCIWVRWCACRQGATFGD
jgi:hypothetical protein